MTEKAIAEGIQTILQAMTDFASADVVLDDWGVLDGPNAAAPFVIIEVADNFISRQDLPANEETWDIKVWLYTKFIDYATSKPAFRDTRQAILDEFNIKDSSNRAAGVSGKMTNIMEIRAGGDIDYEARVFEEEDLERVSDPDFVRQLLIFETHEKSN